RARPEGAAVRPAADPRPGDPRPGDPRPGADHPRAAQDGAATVSPEARSAAPGPAAELPAEVSRLLAEHPDLARIVLSSPELTASLAARPMTLQHLASYPQAVEVLARVLADIETRGVEAVVADGTPVPHPTPLTPEQRAVSARVEVTGSRYQTGFDHRRVGDAEYRSAFLDRMYEQAAVAQDELRRLVVRIASETGGEPGWRRGPKDRVRAEDKIREYRGDVSKLTDLAGAKIEFRSLDDLYQALARLIDEPGVRIVKFKDRFENPQDSGYRDVQMSVRLSNGHVAELRLHLTSLDEVAAWEHALYEVRRDLDALAEELGRALNVAETAIRDGILREEQRLFWEALRTALRGEGGE
ncbi:hypothetical protein AB0I61_12315, partial [Polymorphospora rubra]